MVAASLIVDIMVAAVFAFFMFRGLFRGFSGEIVGFVGFFASLFCGWKFAQPAAEFILQYFPNFDKTIVAIVCGVIIFIIVSLVFAMINGLLSQIVRAANLSFIDHTFGVLIGFIKAGFIIVIFYGALVTFSPLIPTSWMSRSYTMTTTAKVWPYVRNFLQDHKILDFEALNEAGANMSKTLGSYNN